MRLWAAVGLAAVLMIGFLRTWWTLRRHLGERQEVDNFIKLFQRYSDSDGDDLQAYGQMIERSSRVQRLLGPSGLMAQYVAPFGAFVVPNYEIILNALPSMRRDFERGIRRSEYRPIIAETLVRYFGLSEDYVKEKQRDLVNPIVWLREGVATVLLWPVQLLHALGLTSDSGKARVARSPVFRTISGLVALVGLIGSIFTIVLGWSAMMVLLRRLFSR